MRSSDGPTGARALPAFQTRRSRWNSHLLRAPAIEATGLGTELAGIEDSGRWVLALFEPPAAAATFVGLS